MSNLRPECRTTNQPATVKGTTAYYVLYGTVRQQDGLEHGRLHGPCNQHCAIGSYFADHPLAVLEEPFIDEVATVNDSMPRATPKQRKQFVLRWLRWKLASLGMPGFVRSAAAVPPVVPPVTRAAKVSKASKP